jgi:hypothetical protein
VTCAERRKLRRNAAAAATIDRRAERQTTASGRAAHLAARDGSISGSAEQSEGEAPYQQN